MKNFTLYPYQLRARDGICDALESTGFALDASETGLGKSVHAMAAVEEYGVKFFVVCKAVAVPKWTQMIEDAGLSHLCLLVTSWHKAIGGRIADFVIREKRGRVMSFSFARLPSGCIGIFDEVQNASGQNSQFSKLLIGAKRSPRIGGIITLSATAFDSPLSMNALGFCAGLHKIDDFFWWCRSNGCVKSPFGGLYFRLCGERVKKGEKRTHPRGCECGSRKVIDKLHNYLFPAYGVRITRSEAEIDLPEERISVELWDCDKVLPDSIRHLMDRIDEKEVEDLDKADAGQFIGGVEAIRDRQRAELSKAPQLASEVEEYVRAGYACPIFVSHSGTVDALDILLAELGVRHGILDGRNKKRAQKALIDFQAGRIDALITQIQAGSDSVDMDDSVGDRPRCSFISPDYSARNMIQALGRTSRVTTRSKILQRIVFARGTIEEKVYKIAHRRAKNIRAMNDGEWRDGWL